jgi:hypothetical protein
MLAKTSYFFIALDKKWQKKTKPKKQKGKALFNSSHTKSSVPD